MCAQEAEKRREEINLLNKKKVMQDQLPVHLNPEKLSADRNQLEEVSVAVVYPPPVVKVPMPTKLTRSASVLSNMNPDVLSKLNTILRSTSATNIERPVVTLSRKQTPLHIGINPVNGGAEKEMMGSKVFCSKLAKKTKSRVLKVEGSNI